MSPEKGLTHAVVAWQPRGGSIAMCIYTWGGRSNRLRPAVPLVLMLLSPFSIFPIMFLTVPPLPSFRSCLWPSKQVDDLPTNLGLGRGNWFSFVQSPLVLALRTQGWFIYCIVIRPLIEYCDGPLFVGGCIVTVQCGPYWCLGCSYCLKSLF